MTASEIKARARAFLGENGGWFTSAVGNLLAIIIVNAVNGTARAFLGLVPLLKLAQDVQVGKAAPEALVQVMPQFMLGLSVAMLIAMYLGAVFSFGTASLSIAVVRGGAKVGHVFSGFGRGIALMWMLALMQMYVFLWTLLFIVPGIRAVFSYSLMYYVRVDHPDWGANQCLAESKRLMNGNRWRLFCLFFSFIGWFLLVVATLGLAAFWVLPYLQTSVGAFYEDLLDRDGARADLAGDGGKVGNG